MDFSDQLRLTFALATATEDVTVMVDPDRKIPTEGYVVGGAVPPLTLSPHADHAALPILAWILKHSDRLEECDTVGRWTDTETGLVHLDMGDIYAGVHYAKLAGRARNELAVWDLANGEEIRL